MMHFLTEQLSDFPESSDRRARVRRNPSALAYLEVGESNGGIVLNVSETGLAVSVAQAFAENEIPVLSFRLPELDRTFQASAEIVWLSESKKTAGVRFVKLAEQERAQIRNWIRAEIVAAELQIPQEKTADAEVTPELPDTKSVLIMPSPRRVAREVESEESRDEARATEFDRMFPSEASVGAQQPAGGNEPTSDIAHAARIASVAHTLLNDEDLIGAASPTQISPVPVDSMASRRDELPVVEPAVPETPTGADWRDEWERFHRQRENNLRGQAFETPVPALTPAIGVDAVSPAHEAVETTPMMAYPEWPRDSAFTELFARPHQSIPQYGEASTEESVAAGAGKRRQNPVGIFALSTVLIVMCFILGYAIQPGSFRFAAAKSPDAIERTATASDNPQTPQHAASHANSPASANAAGNQAVFDSTPLAVRSGKKPVTPERSADAVGNSAEAIDAPATTASIGTVTTTPALANPTTPSTPAEGSKPAPSAPGADVTIDAPVPVSFFPVTAPSGGSPPKMMQLPEETVTETPAVVIRSRQFLFVPPQPGPESTHELERVHVGDRIAKIDPTYPAGTTGGIVHLRTTIGPDGLISNVQPISGPTSLIPVAASAVRQWRYKPTDIDGKTIAVEEDVFVEFSASR